MEKYAFITFATGPFASSDVLFYEAARKLIEDGNRVLISPLDWGVESSVKYKQIRESGAEIHLRKRRSRRSNVVLRQIDKIFDRLSDPKATWRFLGRWKPDMIILNDAATYHMLNYRGLVDSVKTSGVKYVTISQYNDENSSLSFPLYQQAAEFFTNAARCVFVSKRNLEVAERQLCARLENGIVIHNAPGCDISEALVYPESSAIRFAMVARLECGLKGQALVLQALASESWRAREWKLSIYGDGPDSQYIRDLVTFLGLQDRVELCGFVDDVRSVWRDHHALILISSGEGKPLAMTEAMGCGRVVITTDVGGNAELVLDGINGFVCAAPTLTLVSEVLEKAYQNRYRFSEMGIKAHAHIQQLQNPPPARVLADLLQSVVGEC